MPIFGSKDLFAISLERDYAAFELHLYLNGEDVLQLEYNGRINAYRWYDIFPLIDWIKSNLKYIISKEDIFPVDVSGESAAEMYNNSFDFETEDEDLLENWYTSVSDWSFKHSWFSARGGSYLADMF